MTTKLKFIILLLFLVQGVVIFWSYTDNKKAENIALLPYKSYLENPSEVTKIDISNQNLDDIYIDLSQFENLEYLNLSDNQFKSIPEEIFDLPKLKTLLLAGNELYLPNKMEFPINRNIEKLDLSRNHLYKILDNTFISHLQGLKYLNLSENGLEKVPNLTNSKIDTLLLHDNSINIDNTLQYLLPIKQMKYLGLSNNNINRQAHNSTRLLKLNAESVDLSYNFLEFPFNLFDANYNPNLKTINLSNCRFINIETAIAENNIESMDFSNSNIDLSDTLLLNSKKLKYLNLGKVPFYNLAFLSLSLEYLSIDLEKEKFMILPNLKVLSINGDISATLDFYSTYGEKSDLLNDLNLPKLEKIIIRNYQDNGLKEILKTTFPNIEIEIE